MANIVAKSLVCGGLAAILAAAMCVWHAPGPLSESLLGAGIGLLGGYALYFGMGIALLGLTGRRWSFLMRSPRIVTRMLMIGATSVLPGRNTGWVKMPR